MSESLPSIAYRRVWKIDVNRVGFDVDNPILIEVGTRYQLCTVYVMFWPDLCTEHFVAFALEPILALNQLSSN